MSSQTAATEDSATGVIAAAPWRIRVVSVLPDYRLALTFCDGSGGVIDCSSVLTSANPGIYAPLTDAGYFSQVKLELGALTWPNGADLDPGWLHDELKTSKTWAVPF